jgi:hypothetical protein
MPTLTKADLFCYLSSEITARCDFTRYMTNINEKYIVIYFPMHPTITKWIAEWVDIFNNTPENTGCILNSYIDDKEDYIIERINPDELHYPTTNNANYETIDFTQKQYNKLPTDLISWLDQNEDSTNSDDDKT